jgi:hypothetical protein
MVTASIFLDRRPTVRSRTPLRRPFNDSRIHFLFSILLPSPTIVLEACLALMPGLLMHDTMLCTAAHAHESRASRFMDLAGHAGGIQAPAKIWDCAEGGTCGEIIVAFELRFGRDCAHVSV